MYPLLLLSLALAGSLAGIAYSLLGIAAIKHLDSAGEIDRTVGWTLWWCLDFRRYNARGKRLCTLGGLFLAGGGACWIAWFVLQRP